MPTTLRLILLLMLGLFGLQVGYGYDAPISFVSGAQNIVAAIPESQAATVESAASVPLNFSRTRAAWDNSESIGLISNFVAAESGGAKTVEQLVQEAQAAYPGKAGVEELHHITPKYLGGAADGPLAPLDAAYHQQITNEFRRLAPSGQEPPSPAELQRIMQEVYQKYPLPPGTAK